MFPVDEIAAIVGGRLLRATGRTTPRHAVHDSRQVAPGDLFVALAGRRADGHDFLTEAFARGAGAALISDPARAPQSVNNLIVVDDVLPALHRLAAQWRNAHRTTIVGITGSNGKTTTRTLLAHLLRDPMHPSAVFEPPGNYNTEIGLPLALLSMPPSAAYGVFELGAERPGDIATLAAILAPHVGMITSVGPSHLRGFGSVEAIAAEKGKLAHAVSTDGWAAVNADSPPLRRLSRELPGRCIAVGLEHGAVRGRLIREAPQLEMTVPEPPLRLRCPLLGRHNATNLLLAVVAAHRLGVAAEAIEERASTFTPVPHRLHAVPSPLGTILDDSYNANPASTIGALHVLAAFGGPQTLRVFVFGEMRDLGADSRRHHRAIAELASRLDVDLILPVGDQALSACQDRPSPAVLLVDRDAIPRAIQARRREAGAEAAILVKGSRALELDRLVERLRRTTT